MYRILFVMLCTTLTVSAQTSVDAILKEVESNNLELKAIISDNKASLLEIKSANTPDGPSIEYSPFYNKGYRGIASSELVISQEFDFPTLYGQRNRQTKLEGNTMDCLYEVRRREIILEARLLCTDIIAQNQRIELFQERLLQNDRMISLLQKRMDAGDANILDMNKTRMERMQAAQELAEAQNTLCTLHQQLKELNGNKPVSLTENRFPEFNDVLPDTFPTMLPEVKSAESALEASRHNETLAKNSWLPSIKVGYRRNTEETTGLNGFLVGASFNIFGQGSKVKAARKRRETAEIRLLEAHNKANATQQMRHEQLKQLRNVMDHEDVNLIRETLPLLEKALQHGQINALQYYTEYNDLYSKLLNHISIHCQYIKLYEQIWQKP